MFTLTTADFPLIAIGASVYGRSQSSPILTATSGPLALEIARRLNAGEPSMQMHSSTQGEKTTALVYGHVSFPA